MKLAIAQIVVEKGNLAHNLARHLFFCGLAADEKADLVVFPELSLTGYEPELAEALAVDLTDPLWEELKRCAREHQLVISAGMPLRTANGIQIGAVQVWPDGTLQAYAKQNLYTGEDRFFVPGVNDYQFMLQQEKISMAICADISDPRLPARAHAQNATIYLAPVMVSKKGLTHDRTLLQNYAEQYGMLTVMANYGGVTGGYDCGGYSSVWSEQGELIGELAHDKEGMLLVEKAGQSWITKTLAL
jgi:predicted amidohydrolase